MTVIIYRKLRQRVILVSVPFDSVLKKVVSDYGFSVNPEAGSSGLISAPGSTENPHADAKDNSIPETTDN
jgi:hypothetical protein